MEEDLEATTKKQSELTLQRENQNSPASEKMIQENLLSNESPLTMNHLTNVRTNQNEDNDDDTYHFPSYRSAYLYSPVEKTIHSTPNCSTPMNTMSHEHTFIQSISTPHISTPTINTWNAYTVKELADWYNKIYTPGTPTRQQWEILKCCI